MAVPSDVPLEFSDGEPQDLETGVSGECRGIPVLHPVCI